MKASFSAVAALVLGILAFPPAAHADPYHFLGDFRFTGLVQPTGRLTVDVVDTRLPDANQRVTDIEKNGGTCMHKTSAILRCTTMTAGTNVPQTSLARIRAKNRGLSVDFAQETSAPTVVNRSESLVEWSILQPVKWKGGAVTGYRYLEMSGGISKLVLQGQQDDLELVTTDGQDLQKYESVIVLENHWRWHEDMANVILSRSR